MNFARWLFFLGVFVNSYGLAKAAPSSIAIVGLRPTSALGNSTELKQLAEAQQLRTVTETVVGLVAGLNTLGHDSLRRFLGSAYLVDLFDCNSDTECIVNLVEPLKKESVEVVVWGDYKLQNKIYDFKIVVYDLNRGKIRGNLTFSIKTEDLQAPSAWRPYFEPLFSTVAKLEIVTNVVDATCTLDAMRCQFAPGTMLMTLPVGEHVIELSKKGYRTVSQVVTVDSNTRQKLAIVLEEAKQQVVESPNRVAEAAPSAPSGNKDLFVKMFGQLSIAFIVDPNNIEPGYDFYANESDVKKEWAFDTDPGAFAGAVISTPTEGKWVSSGLVIVPLVGNGVFGLIRVKASRPEKGFSVEAGLLASPIVGTQSMRLLRGFLTWGDVGDSLLGAKVSQTVGNWLFEIGSGRTKDIQVLNPSRFSYPWPLVQARIAWVVTKQRTQLTGAKALTTVSLAGAAGKVRVGNGIENAAAKAKVPTAVTPIEEDLQSWIAALDFNFPISKFALSGSAFIAEAAGDFSAGNRHTALLDPTTGLHTPIRSWGGFLQLSLDITTTAEILLIAGTDQTVTEVGDKIYTDFQQSEMRSNSKLAAIFTKTWVPVRLGFQTQVIHTDWAKTPASTMFGGLVELALSF